MKIYLLSPLYGLLKTGRLLRCVVCRHRTYVRTTVLGTLCACIIICCYFQGRRWLESDFNSSKQLYPFLIDYNEDDLKLQDILKEYSKDTHQNKFYRDVHILGRSLDINEVSESKDDQRKLFEKCRRITVCENGVYIREIGFTVQEECVECRRCPRRPPHFGQFVGEFQPNTTSVTIDALVTKYPDMEIGGRIRPRNCVPAQRLAIIIPYRNRLSHLLILMNNLIPFCERQQADVTFFVIEQDQRSVFNRGALLNVGFKEAEKIGRFDCFIFHDVDLLPLSERNLYRCGENPRHFAVALNKYNYNLAYLAYFGGVVGFQWQQYLDINGHSNLYFGWGGEDDDLLYRSINKGYTISRYATHTARYDMITHERDKGNDINPHRKALLRSTILRQDIEGLSTTKYKVIQKQFKHLFTWITVSLNITDILKTAPDYTIRDMFNLRNGSSTRPVMASSCIFCLLFIFCHLIHWR